MSEKNTVLRLQRMRKQPIAQQQSNISIVCKDRSTISLFYCVPPIEPPQG
ncbi:class III lanthipeptide [Alkalihalobacillus pseudalcaliphilus]